MKHINIDNETSTIIHGELLVRGSMKKLYITSASRLTSQNWPFTIVNGVSLRQPVNPFEHEALL